MTERRALSVETAGAECFSTSGRNSKQPKNRQDSSDLDVFLTASIAAMQAIIFEILARSRRSKTSQKLSKNFAKKGDAEWSRALSVGIWRNFCHRYLSDICREAWVIRRKKHRHVRNVQLWGRQIAARQTRKAHGAIGMLQELRCVEPTKPWFSKSSKFTKKHKKITSSFQNYQKLTET